MTKVVAIARASSAGGAQELTGRAWATLLVLCGAIFLDALDVSMIGVALPAIRADLGMSTSALQFPSSPPPSPKAAPATRRSWSTPPLPPQGSRSGS